MDETNFALHLRPTWIGPYHFTTQYDRTSNGSIAATSEAQTGPSVADETEAE
jgi:hypothetical protein